MKHMHVLRRGLLLMVVMVVSCGQHETADKQHDASGGPGMKVQEPINSDNPRDYLHLTHADTIIRRATYYFSNERTPDSFILKIAPGPVSSAPAELQIRTAGSEVIYSMPFEAWYFVRDIFVPDSIPTEGGQDIYDQYMANYRNSLTQTQIREYFNRSVAQFFTEINPVPFGQLGNPSELEDMIADRDFWNEVAADTSIRLIEMVSFSRDEGGVVIGFSKQRNKVVTLMDAD